MKSIFCVVPLAVMAVFLSSCATALMRPNPPEGRLYPATSLDVEAFVQGAVKGKPAFALADPDDEHTGGGVLNRLLFGFGSIIDLPISLVTDTLLLPFDLWSLGRDEEAVSAE